MSEKAATDQDIDGLREYLGKMAYPNQQYFSMIGTEAFSLIARIEADKEKIEQLEFEAEWADSKIKALQAEITTWKQTAEQRANDCVVYQTEITALRGLCGRAGEEIYQMAHYINPDPEQGGNQLADELLDRASKGEL